MINQRQPFPLFIFIYFFILHKIIIITTLHTATQLIESWAGSLRSLLGLSRRPPLLPDKASLAVNDYRSYTLIYRFVSKLHWYWIYYHKLFVRIWFFNFRLKVDIYWIFFRSLGKLLYTSTPLKLMLNFLRFVLTQGLCNFLFERVLWLWTSSLVLKIFFDEIGNWLFENFFIKLAIV